MERNLINQKVKQMIVERLNLDLDPTSIKDDEVLFGDDESQGLGLDSVDSLDLAVGINNEFDVEVTEENIDIFKSVGTIVDFISVKLS